MLKTLRIIIFILVFTVFFALTCNALNTIDINQLIENAATLDNKEVTITGELIGEALERGEYTWININDTTNAIGVWAKESEINQNQIFGDYKNKGDIVEISGTFNKACKEHGGDVDIHLSSIKTIEKGHSVIEKVLPIKIITTVALITIALLVLTMYFKLVKRQEKSNNNL